MSFDNRTSKIAQVLTGIITGIVTFVFVVIGVAGLVSELKNYAREPLVHGPSFVL